MNREKSRVTEKNGVVKRLAVSMRLESRCIWRKTYLVRKKSQKEEYDCLRCLR